MNFSIILVNFNSKVFLKKCLKSLALEIALQDSFKKIEIIIVNNDTKKLFLKEFYNLNLKIRIINNNVNLGFGQACNIGAKKAQGEILFFLNPDTKIISGDFSLIVLKFKKNSDIGIIGTKIIKASTKKPQPWTSGKKSSLLRILFRTSINQSWNKQKPVFVDWVAGTSFFIKKVTFEKLKGFDEKFFMYFEDQDLCLRIKNINKKCLFLPTFSVLHQDGKSWKSGKDKKTYYYQSQDYFFKKHFSPWHRLVLTLIKKIFNKK